jgi:hypothetical protein
MADPKRPRGRPPSPQGAKPRAEVQRAYRERRKAAGKVLRVIDTWAEMTPAEITEMRRAAIRYLHVIAGCAVPTAEAQVSEAMAGMHRTAAAAGQLPGKKLAATADILRQILAPIATDLAGLRDRALLLTGFAGALRRAELAAIRVEHLEPCERGLRLTLPHSKGERTGRGVTVALPYV